MFYEQPKIKSEIRNLKRTRPEGFVEDIWTFDIFFDDIFVASGKSYLPNREDAIKEAIRYGLALKERELTKRELAAVGDQLYIKFDTDIYEHIKKKLNVDGLYQIYRKGNLHCCFYSVSLEEAISYLQEKNSDMEDMKLTLKRTLMDM